MADGVGGASEVSESEKESKLMEWFKSGPKLMDVSSFSDGFGARGRRISENMKRRTVGWSEGREGGHHKS